MSGWKNLINWICLLFAYSLIAGLRVVASQTLQTACTSKMWNFLYFSQYFFFFTKFLFAQPPPTPHPTQKKMINTYFVPLVQLSKYVARLRQLSSRNLFDFSHFFFLYFYENSPAIHCISPPFFCFLFSVCVMQTTDILVACCTNYQYPTAF